MKQRSLKGSGPNGQLKQIASYCFFREPQKEVFKKIFFGTWFSFDSNEFQLNVTLIVSLIK